MLNGISEGFRIGFDCTRSDLVSKGSNMVSAREHPEVVEKYLAEEKSMGRIGVLPPFSSGYQTSLFGVIPKKSKPGKWRLIVDLSSPSGHSVNDGIEKELCSLSYVSVDQLSTAFFVWAGGP